MDDYGVYQALSDLIAGCAAKNYNAGAMRIVAGCLLVAVGSVLVMQSSPEFHSRYGEPDMERFMARPGISLSVEYGSDHLACVARLEPPQSLLGSQEIQRPLMPSDAVSEVIEEIAPTTLRGNKISDGSFQSGCGVGAFSDYANLSIMRATNGCVPDSPNRDASTTINFKRDICAKQKPPVTVTPAQSQ